MRLHVFPCVLSRFTLLNYTVPANAKSFNYNEGWANSMAGVRVPPVIVLGPFLVHIKVHSS